MKWVDELGAGSVRNFNDVVFEKIDTVDGIQLKDFTIKRKSCFNCPLHCRAEIEIGSLHQGFIGQRPDYEAMEALGPRIGNGDAAETVYLNTMCNKFGMDPRGFKASALGFAVGSMGTDFTNVYARFEFDSTPEQAEKRFGTKKAADRLSEEGKAAVVRYSIIGATILDALGLCKIPYLTLLNDFDLLIAVELVNAIVGWNITTAELAKCGERIVNAERIFNLKRGMKSTDDTLPDKFIEEPIENGICKGSKVNLATMLKEYYKLMGWNEDGYPMESKIRELGLEKVMFSRKK